METARVEIRNRFDKGGKGSRVIGTRYIVVRWIGDRRANTLRDFDRDEIGARTFAVAWNLGLAR